MSKKKNKVLLIGWDAADWKIINPLIEKGEMPALEKMINNGVMGNITTLEPILSPMLWSSIATGKLADKHGVLGFTEPDPVTGGIKPISVTSRKVKAIWNILTQNKLKSNVVGWWPSHPAEPIDGVCVSNFYPKSNKPINEKWEMAKGTIHPKKMEKELAAFRIHPAELTYAHILPFIPNLKKIDQEKDKRINSFAKILAETATIQACGTYLMENTAWDFMAMYFDGIDHFSHGFMRYHPPKLDKISNEDFEIYKDVVNGAYRFHDMMLEAVLNLIDENTTVILISDHGFHSDHLRPLALPQEPAGPAYEHRHHGIFCMMGPNVKKDELIYGVSLLDITPTILQIFGLPIGEDMDGKVLTQAFEKLQPIKTIPSWEKIDGFCGMHPKDLQQDPLEAKAAIDQLVELGYIDKPDEDKAEASRKTVRELNYNLARVYISTNRHELAIPILEDIYKTDPDETRFTLRLAICYQNTKEFDKARFYIEKTKEIALKNAQKQAERLSKEQNKKVLPNTNFPSIDLLEASIFIDENKPKKALEILNKAKAFHTLLPKKNLHIGQCYLLLKRWKEAEEAFRKVLKFDNNDIAANHGLAVSLLKQGRYEESIEYSLDTIALKYNFAVAHFHLGEALYFLKDYENAVNAFKICLNLNPQIGKARNYLIEIFETHPELSVDKSLIKSINDFKTQSEKEIEKQKKLIKEKARSTITVVSGVPRSGTSMMMQMLVSGGLEAFTDNKRTPDENNPKGYFEHNAVKGLMRNNKFLKDVGDKAVKIVSHLLLNLPSRYHYKIIFMVRDIDEVVASQHKMLERDGKIKPKTYQVSLKEAFKNNLKQIKTWSEKNHNVEILYINYKEALENPKSIAQKINNFLGKDLDIEKMAASVDKSLYRNKLVK